MTYRFNSESNADVVVVLEIKEKLEDVIQNLKTNETVSDVMNLTENSLASYHLRFLGGGRHKSIKDERIFRFTFAETPGIFWSLFKKLKDTNKWNVT